MTESKAVELLKNNEERRTSGTYIVVKHLSIIALEKQIPKKTVIKPTSYCHAYYCPVCNSYIHSIATRREVILAENIFCGVCGQKLDWSDE